MFGNNVTSDRIVNIASYFSLKILKIIQLVRCNCTLYALVHEKFTSRSQEVFTETGSI